MNADSRATRSRRFDDGSPFALQLARADGQPPEVIGLATFICDNVDCDCAEVNLVAHRLDASNPTRGNGTLGQPYATALFHVDSARLEPGEAGSAAVNQELVERLEQALTPDHLELLRERYQRAKHDPSAWQKADWQSLDRESMVHYSDLFEHSWDWGVHVNGEQYWLVDAWCLKPGCRCSECAVEVRRGEGSLVDVVYLDADTGRVVRGDARAEARTAANAWLRLPTSRKVLRERWSSMRDLARALPEPVAKRRAAVRNPPPGRNDPCPCGSGRKYKKCCARTGQPAPGAAAGESSAS